jgi:TRAP-type C4-dicarboxylate transport system permease small subunit
VNGFKKLLGNLDVAVAYAILFVLVGLTVYGVFMRYIVVRPLTWLEEVQLACMVWIVFAAGGAAFRTGSHVAIEMVADLFPQKMQRFLTALISLIVVVVLGDLFYQSLGFIALFARSGRSTSMLKIPYKVIYGIAPVSYILMIISYFYALAAKVKPEAEEATE